MTAIIALLTDFGEQDPFVGIMKGVIARRAPEALCIDLTHHIPPGDVFRAAVVLWESVPYFPPGTVFLVVVDPGVGTRRRAVLVESGGYRFIGPDNGVFSFVLRPGWRAWVLENPYFRLPRVSTTFHGRDIFAPAAAHAALGIPGEAFGSPVEDLVRLVPPRLDVTSTHIRGEVLFADRFGNVLTSLGTFEPAEEDVRTFRPWLDPNEAPRRMRLRALLLPEGRGLKPVRTFGELPEGEPGFLVGSTGLIEIAVNRGNAAELLALKRGQRLTLEIDPVD